MKQFSRCPTCGARHKRSNEQNAKYWMLLNEISEQIKPQGKVYSSEVWATYFKERFLGCDEIVLPNGKVRNRPRSTTSLDVEEMSDYITRIEVWFIEHGGISNG